MKKFLSLLALVLLSVVSLQVRAENKTITWDFSSFTEQLILAGDNMTVQYDGLTLVGNSKADYTSDYVQKGAGFHMNGASSSSIRHIVYAPEYSGTMTVTYRSNNATATDRITAIGTAVKTFKSSNVNEGSVPSEVLSYGFTDGATSKTITADLTAGTKYYFYFADGGQAILKLEYTYAEPDPKTVYIDPVGDGTWLNDNAKISLNVYTNGLENNAWSASETLSNGVIKYTFDGKYTKMIIVRGNTANTFEDGKKWNQTDDISFQANKLYKANGYTGDSKLAYTVSEADYEEPAPDTSYKVDFNNAISTSDHSFKVASNWKHIVGIYHDSWADGYMNYSYKEDAGKDGSGTLLANRQYAQNVYNDGAVCYDLLVTPVVSGTIKIWVKASTSAGSSNNAFVELYSVNEGVTEKGELLKQFKEEIPGYNTGSNTDWVELSYDVTEAQRIGIRAQYVYLDDFSASNAVIEPEKSIEIASAEPSATTGTIYWEQQANGKVKVSYTVTVTNNGEVALTQGMDNYSVSVFNRKTGDVYFTVPVPQDLTIGATSEPFEVSGELETTTWANSNTYINMDLKENLQGSTVQRAQSHYKAYEPKFVFRVAESGSASSLSSAQAFGMISEETTKNFEIANTGTAPLTIKSITLPTGFTSANMPEIPNEGLVIAKNASQALNITLPVDANGAFNGNLVIVYLDKNDVEQTYELAFSGNVLAAGTWFADFNVASSSEMNYPAASIAEGGIRFGTTYISSGNYDGYLYSYTYSSYATENNKFITPKLHANAGDKLTFDVRRDDSGSATYNLKVYVSTDRKTWGDPIYSVTAADLTSSFQTKEISFDAQGDYYVAFAIYGVRVDNLIGLTKVDVAHDLYIKSVNWPDASVKSGTSLSKPSLDVIPLTDETAEAYTVKYVCGETVLAEGTPVALTASANSSKTFSFSWTPEVESTTAYPATKVVFEFTDGTKIESAPFDLTVTNEPKFHFVSTMPSSKWNEPSDHTTPIAFGKTNTADAQTFYIYNWGSAPLTVKSIAVPEGFTATPAEQFNVVAFDENNLSAAAQAVEITFSATEAGAYSGNMVITYVNGAGEDATFELAISGTKLDPTKWYANFDDGGWPVGSVYQSNVSSSNGGTYSAPNYYITSSSTTDNMFVTPKLTAAAGDKLAFDAKLYSSYWSEGAVKVYAAATRDEVLNAEEGTTRTLLFSVSGQDAENPMTTDYQTFEVPALEGDYFYGFEISNRPYVDEIYGLTPAAVAHDWAIASSNVPAEAMQNVASTATVNILNLGLADEAAEDITVTAYVDGKAVATAQGVAIPMNHKLSDAGTQLSVSYLSPKAGTYSVYVEVKAGEYSVATEPVDVVFAAEEVKADADMAINGTTYEVPLYLNYKNSESVTMYNAEALAAAGLSAGSKIKKITYKGYKTTDEQTTSFQVYYKWTDDQTLAQPATDYPYAAADNGMTKLIDEDHTWAKVGSSTEMGEMIVLDFTENPLTYEAGKSLVIYMHSYVDGYKTAYFEKSTLSSDFCYTRKADAATLSSSFSKAVPAAIHFTLDASAATLAGTVKTSAGAGIANATVTLKADNGVQYSGTTDETGAYNFNVIQAGLDFTATVEAEGYLKKEFAYNLGGESKTLNTTMYTQMGIVGGIGDAAGLGFSWDADKVMTQDEENPNIFTVVVPDVEVAEANTKLDYKLRADGAWLGDDYKYELPSSGNNNYVFEVADTYTLTFTANVAEHTLELTAESNTLKEAMELAEDDDAVAVGKLRKAIKDNPADVAALKDAIEQFNADNADQEKDETAKVATNGWKKFTGNEAAGVCATKYAPAINTYDGRENVQLAEVYEGTVETTGTIIYQDITGLTNGKYKVGFYGNAFFTSGRGFESTMEDGANDVAYVFANNQKEFITARIATETTENNFRQFDVEVTDGTIKLGMGKEKAGTNWHTMQIYQLTWFTTAKEVYAQDQNELAALVTEAKALAEDEYKTEGKDDLNAVIATAEEATTEKANWYNISEIEEIIANLKAAVADFKKANRYIDFANEGKYYIIDAESGKMMAAGHDYGTRGIVNEIGLDLTFTTHSEPRTVSIDSRVSNGGNSHFLGNNLYMDSSEWGWAFESYGSGFYIIEPNEGKYISIDANDNLVLSDTPREWIIVTKDDMMAQRLGELAAATAENPVDATFLLQNPNFNRNDQRVSAWEWIPSETAEENPDNWNNHNFNGGNQVNNCAESYHAAFTVKQTISGAPAGKYTLTAQGFYRQDAYEGDAPAAPMFFANGVNGNVPVKTGEENSMSAASASFTNGLYTIEEPIEFEVAEDGMIYVGITASTNTQWVIWDNFQLTYYGVPEITISEGEDFVPVDSKFANVTLERTFSNENWNTFVVPFDIDNATLTEKFGEVQVAEYSDAGDDANNVTVSFNKMETPAITANVPVLLKTSVAPTSVTFSGVQVKAAAEVKKAGTYFDFVGSYDAQEYVTTGNYYLLANKIYKSTSDEGTFIKGTRAYLKAKDAAAEARIVNFTIADEIITGIKVIDANNDAKENIYNLNGQKVNNAKKGLYIKNGKKVMMK